MKTRKCRRSRKGRRGGSKYSYYKYNCNPRIFTNTTSRLFGGGPNTFFPQPVVNVVRGSLDTNTKMMNTYRGNYQSMSSSPLEQPINFK